jgi:hypothetical protein
LEYLRGLAHLRARTNTFGAIFRIRSKAALAVHKFFQVFHYPKKSFYEKDNKNELMEKILQWTE